MYDDLSLPRAAIEGTRGKLSGQTRYETMMEQLYQTAQAVCQVIDDYQPDLIITLAHGAWGMLWAVEAYWVTSKGMQAFPPVMITNLGREKMERYERVRADLPCARIAPFVADYAGDEEVGYFLSWLEQQHDWIDQFRQQAFTVISADPERILILDDAMLEGCTYRLAIGLAEAVFPKATVRFINGNVLAWRSELAYPWLEKQIPGWSEEQHQKLIKALYSLATGTEDSHIDSLAWEPITHQSRIMETVSAYLPAERWLELPGWIMQTIQAQVQERYHRDILSRPLPPPPLAEDLRDHRRPRVIEEQSLTASETIVKYVWQHGSISLQEAVDLLKFARPLVARVLHAQLPYGTLIAKGPARSRRYLLPPEAATPEEMLPPEPPLDTFWVMPGRLLAGNAVSTQQEWLIGQVNDLTGKGITCILHVLIHDFEDGAKIAEAVHSSGTAMRLQFLHLPARRRLQGMGEVLSAIDQAIKQGEVVYLSAPGMEQAAAIAACYLVQHGDTGPQALAKVTQLRQAGFQPWHTYPRTRHWRQLVLRWARNFHRSNPPISILPAEQ